MSRQRSLRRTKPPLEQFPNTEVIPVDPANCGCEYIFLGKRDLFPYSLESSLIEPTVRRRINNHGQHRESRENRER